MSAIDLTECPECGAAAHVADRFVLESTDGPVEHVRLACARRHCFLMPAASMVRSTAPADPATRATGGARPPAPVERRPR